MTKITQEQRMNLVYRFIDVATHGDKKKWSAWPNKSRVNQLCLWRKAHGNLLRDIREVIRKARKEWAFLNFQPIEERAIIPTSEGGRKDSTYKMTQNSFTMLAMGF